MRFVLQLLILFIAVNIATAQPCTYLAYDGFEYSTSASLNGLSGGTGWQFPWDVQNANVAIPGYQTASSTNSLVYGSLQTRGGFMQGGNVYLTAGRRLSTGSSGPFASYVAQNAQDIGTVRGDTLWLSFLLQKNIANSQQTWVSFHNQQTAWCPQCGNSEIAFGYFGTASEVAGERRWSLRTNGVVTPFSVPVQIGVPVFTVVQMIFNTTNTVVNIYANPATLGSVIPTIATYSHTTTALFSFRSMAVYLGNDPFNASFDEVRFATSYSCVAPDAATNVNLPPIAIPTVNITTGTVPITVQFNATASYDPEAQPLTYVWNFGDASPVSTAAIVQHTFSVLGELPVSLTVTDNLGLQHTQYLSLRLRDSSNTFPCQSTITPLQMAQCNGTGGRIRVNIPNGAIHTLRNLQLVTMPATNGNEYHNLSPGEYILTIAGANTCADSMRLFIRTDSTSCNGWSATSSSMSIGTNLEGFSDWSRLRPMKNLFKHIRSEILTYSNTCNCWDGNVRSQLSFDANGYPLSLPQTTTIGETFVRYIISADGGNLQTNKQYVLLFDGAGNVQLQGSASIQSQTAGRIVFTPLNTGNFWINITASTLGNHIRNIRLLRIEDEFANLQEQPFYQGFLDKICPFSLLRFMDWGNTNNNPIQQWTERTTTGTFSYSGTSGVPYEVMIQLANQTKKDVWICVPHQADSHYIAQMAQVFKNNLDTSLTVYLEYSNEVWNWIFTQSHYNDQNRPANLSYGRAYSDKARRVFRIWHQVYGTQKSRVKRVLGIQGGFNGLNEQILSYIPASEWDFGSPTHYFGLDHSSSGNPVLTSTATVSDIMANAQNSWNAFKSSVKQDYNTVHVFGKEVVTYEGGQHFVGNVFGIPYSYQQAMWQAQYSPLMYNMYIAMHDTIKNWGCKLATNFSMAGIQESIYGSWGVVSDIDTPPPFMQTAPKYQALLDRITPFPYCTNLGRIDTLNVPLQQGWNMISSYVSTANMQLENIASGVTGLYLLKNNSGASFVPSFSINQIGAWQPLHGYQAYATTADTLQFIGNKVSNRVVQLQAGWNIAPYLHSSPMSVEQAFSSLGTALFLAKDNNGLNYIPSFGIRQFSALQPTQAYQVYVTTSATMVLPTMRRSVAEHSQHEYPPIGSGKFVKPTSRSATYIVQFEAPVLNMEIYIRGKAGIYGNAYIFDDVAAITAWGRDSLSGIRGAEEGEDLGLFVFSPIYGEIKVNIVSIHKLSGEEVPSMQFQNSEIYIIKAGAIPSGMNDIKEQSVTIAPMPATDKLVVYPTSTLKGNLSCKLYSLQGVLVGEWNITQNEQVFSLPLPHLTNGVYILNISDEMGNMVHKKVMIAK